MIVVSDATPLNVLVRIGHIDLLAELFGEVVIPSAVRDELSHAATPEVVRAWLNSNPHWLVVRAPTGVVDEVVARHRGERQALQLANELNADLLLVDDLRARRIATSFGVKVIGTIGILERAAIARRIDLHEAVRRLRQTDFYVSDGLLTEALRRVESALGESSAS
jgi:predicted nucleic acid-binding protein